MRKLGRLGLIPVGFIDEDPVPRDELEQRLAPVLGSPAEFDEVVDESGAQQAIFAFQLDPDSTLRPLVRLCRERGIGVAIVPRLFDDATNRIVLEHVGGIPVFELRQVDPRGWQFALKHAIDRILAALLLVVLAPILIAVAIAVRISLGPRSSSASAASAATARSSSWSSSARCGPPQGGSRSRPSRATPPPAASRARWRTGGPGSGASSAPGRWTSFPSC